MYQHMRELREDKHLTQKQMGEVLECSQRAYSNYELGKRNIPIETLIKLADFHGVTIDYLVGRTNKID